MLPPSQAEATATPIEGAMPTVPAFASRPRAMSAVAAGSTRPAVTATSAVTSVATRRYTKTGGRLPRVSSIMIRDHR
jgi:hypothetical protein